MHPISLFRPLGAIAVAISAAALAVLVRVWPQGTHKTFSQHAAAHRQAIVYYVVLFSVVLPLLLLFFLGWFVPALHVSRWFDVYPS